MYLGLGVDEWVGASIAMKEIGFWCTSTGNLLLDLTK